MKSYEFFRKIYNPVGKFAFTNQTTFVKELVVSAGSTFFDEKDDENYATRFISGKLPLTLPLKRSFGGVINRQQLTAFFIQKIPDVKLPNLLQNFDIVDSVAPSKKFFAEALAEQFALFISSEENDVADIVADTYKKLKCYNALGTSKSESTCTSAPIEYRKNPWRYSIVLLDDMKETLDILKDAINTLFINETRYEVDIYTHTTSMKVIEQCSNSNIDVFVLDVARKVRHSWQDKEFDHFGYDLFKLLVYERPNTLVRSKFIFYSKLSRDFVQKEFGQLYDLVQETRRRELNNVVEMPEIEYLKKQDTSAFDVAECIKKYLDTVYMKENSCSIE